MKAIPIALALTLAASACLAVPPATSSDAAAPARGLSFAQAHCAQCHAVRPLEVSANPEAPQFAEIVDRPGLTRTTLAAFLRDSHNFPEKMDFDIDPEEIDALSAYMLTLRDEEKR
ncbi:hypothetical protein B2G71_05130 [Novosphingobium sp. PC22D]|uniref:c-type cytochrome n=1 Tax=Novosphingobium sp. PC22D TaxID=1962403 RepID=UPI000BEFD8B9|nr:c-type cytochrome [Novosphingobium sp. PC22D]PEQ13705.1 hypothetical protein B2G71_05130 [Novosphingobium sp. PC22D]